MRKIIRIIALCFFIVSCNEVELKEEAWISEAVAVLQPINNSKVTGIIYFQDNHGVIEVVADINGLERGNHGFHTHTFGDLSENNGSSTGAVYNPLSSVKGNSEGVKRLPGNMGNIYSMDESLAQYKQDIFSLSLNGKNSIIGRSVVVHKNEDDYETVPCGNAGKVIAAGVIGISSSQ